VAKQEPMIATSATEILTEEELALRAQSGCAASFEQLVRRLQVPLVQFLMRRTRCRADAEDLAQETLVRAHRALARYQPLWRFRTWLFTIAHRLSLNLRRKQAREESMMRPDEVRSAMPDVADSLGIEENRRTIWQTVATVLDEEQVSVLWLYYVEEMSTADLGRVLGRTRGAIKTILFRARKKLMPSLRELVDDGDAAICAAGPESSEPAAMWKVSNV
jgi:RNA polymerase sigma-70 factor, ECF subfamily